MLKRRRLDTPEQEEEAAVKLIRRDEKEVRRSLEDLYNRLSAVGDLVVTVHGAQSTREFSCLRALLAAASRPLDAMLFGRLPAVTVQKDGTLQLSLRDTEPWCFDQLLRFIHGLPITLDVESAIKLHHVGDYFEVLSLRDMCCNFLLNAMREHNCCEFLRRSGEMNCEPLTKKCLDWLTLDFVTVMRSDRESSSLSPEALQTILGRNELVCASELTVFEAVCEWYRRQASAEKFDALPELLRSLRWHLVTTAQTPAVLELAASLQPPQRHASPCLQRHASAGKASACAGQSGNSADGEGTSACDEEISELVERLLREASAEGPHRLATRKNSWGRLVAREAQTGSATPPVCGEWTLACCKEYLVGRSRRTDIRVGQHAPMPYISSQHFRVFHRIAWPEPRCCDSAAASGPSAASASPPVLEPWLEDISQNGTFINGESVGRHMKRVLHDGDKIELVFPHGRLGTGHHPHFTTFTFCARPESEAADEADSLRGASDASPAASPLQQQQPDEM